MSQISALRVVIPLAESRQCPFSGLLLMSQNHALHVVPLAEARLCPFIDSFLARCPTSEPLMATTTMAVMARTAVMATTFSFPVIRYRWVDPYRDPLPEPS